MLAWQDALVILAIFVLWIGVQQYLLLRSHREIRRLRNEKAGLDRDYLTGLLGQAALRRRVDAGERFHGALAVCDLDGFKLINDRLGHLAGDEVLRDIGRLLGSSVRAEDRVYRWGGDEFVLLFTEPNPELAHARMQAIESRLQDFRARGHGALPVKVSWGVAVGNGERLKDVLELADRAMYEQKRARRV